MAHSTVQTALAFILFAVICHVTIANPIPTSNMQETYNKYASLVCEANALSKWEYKLFLDFKSNRFPNTHEVKIVDVPNLLLTDDMGIFDRIQASDIDLLSDHRDYLLHYKYIIGYVLADESNTTSATNFISDMSSIRLRISLTIAQLEDVMIYLGHLSRTQDDIAEASRPYFNPEWEQNVIDRYERDLYVLEQIEMHLTKAVEDFTSMRNGYIDENTTPVACAQVLP